MALTWDERTMATGVSTIDDQHRKLIAKLNELFEYMRLGQGSAKLQETLEWLERYAVAHFSHEEQCMHQVQCPSAAANKAAHAKFIATFGRIKREIERDGPSTRLVIDAQRELSDWLKNHIVKVDTTIRPCVHAGT